MMTHAELTKLEHDLRGLRVLSVYVNGDVANAAARGQWRTELKNAFDDIEASLRGATHADLTTVTGLDSDASVRRMKFTSRHRSERATTHSLLRNATSQERRQRKSD